MVWIFFVIFLHIKYIKKYGKDLCVIVLTVIKKRIDIKCFLTAVRVYRNHYQ